LAIESEIARQRRQHEQDVFDGFKRLPGTAGMWFDEIRAVGYSGTNKSLHKLVSTW
jgi:hypothetical protein